MVAATHLKSLQALELAVRTGSLKGAADALWITPAAAGQRVKALEEYLGVDLLVRGRSGLQPTPALSAALEHLRAAFRELDAAAAALDLQRAHEIHLAAAPDLSELWLKPRLAAFRTAHPNVRFCINGEGDAPLRIGQTDCEISFGPPQPRPDCDLLFHDFVVPISSPENTHRISRQVRRDRLEGFPLLHLDFYRNDPAVPDWKQWVQDHRLHRTAPERGIRFQRIGPALEAVVVASAGLTLCGLALVSDLVIDGRVSLPFPTSTGTWTSHAFAAHFRSEALIRPQVRKFRDWLAGEARTTREWLERRAGARHSRPAKPRHPD